MRFRTIVLLERKTATGLQVPDEIVEALGAGKRPAVRVTVGAHTYRTTVASMGGRFLIPLSAENRAAAQVSAGDEVDVEIELDTEVRDIAVPDDLAAALPADSRAFFDSLTASQRKEWVRWVEESKKAETRTGRIAKAVELLAGRQKTH